MNNNKIDIDNYTKKLVQKTGLENPSSDFTKSVMGQILKDPEVHVSFITDDDKKSTFWLFTVIGFMFIGYIIYYIITNGTSFMIQNISGFFKVVTSFFTDFFNEIAISPFILLALIGVLLLVILDKTIVKYLYTL